MVRVFGIGRTHDGTRLVVGFLAVDQTASVIVAEPVHIPAFAFERVVDRIADLHRDDERPLGAQRILSFVAAGALDAVADDRRRHVKLDFGAVTQLQFGRPESETVLVRVIILFTQFQRVAHGQPRTFHQPRIFGAAIAVKGHVMGVFGESPGQSGRIGVAREDDVAGQIAPREVERHPDRLLADRVQRLVACLDHVDIIAAVGLVVLNQIGPVLGHPRFERLILELNVRFVFVFRAGCQRQKAGNRHA